MKKSAILFLLTLGLALDLRAQLPAAYASQLQYTLDSLCTKLGVKGASAAVYVPGYGTWEGIAGESHTGVAMRSDMALPLNSNSKTYVATAMIKLQEDGKLSLDDTIGKWIQGKANISGAITIRQMLNHTSGLYSYTDTVDFSDSLEADFARIWQPEEMLRFVGAPLFAPGASWSYSNTNYLLAGMIISKVTGKPIEQAIRDMLLTPNGLSNTWFYPQETPTATIPHFWFYSSGGDVDGALFGYTPEAFYSAANSAGALFATAKDNALFWQKLCSGQILNAASLGQWRKTIPLSSSIGYGLGMFRYRSFNSRVVYEHGGTGAGAINENLVDSASGVSISLLTNQESVDNDKLFNVIVKALHRVTIVPPTTITQLPASALWSVYPVPASTTLHIGGVVLSGAQYQLKDMAGRIIRSGNTEGMIPVSDLSSGGYWLELRDQHGFLGTRRIELRR